METRSEKAQKKGDTCNRRYRLAIIKDNRALFPYVGIIQNQVMGRNQSVPSQPASASSPFYDIIIAPARSQNARHIFDKTQAVSRRIFCISSNPPSSSSTLRQFDHILCAPPPSRTLRAPACPFDTSVKKNRRILEDFFAILPCNFLKRAYNQTQRN